MRITIEFSTLEELDQAILGIKNFKRLMQILSKERE